MLKIGTRKFRPGWGTSITAAVAMAIAVSLDTHRGYAFQWYSLAALILVLYVVLNLNRY